jgi:HEAT repeat protein
LLKFGPEAHTALSDLKGALTDENHQCGELAADALARLGTVGIPVLEEALLDRRCKIRLHVAGYLGDLGARAKVALPTLLGALQDEDPYVRLVAASALLRIDRSLGIKAGVPVLNELLKSEKSHRHLEVMGVLRELGPEAGMTAAALGQVLSTSSQDLEMHQQAALTLAEIGPESRAAIPALRGALGDSPIITRMAAARALWQAGCQREAAPIVMKALKDPDNEVRKVAAETLGKIGPKARMVVPELRSMLQDKKAPMRADLALALWRVGKEGDCPSSSRGQSPFLPDAPSRESSAGTEELRKEALDALIEVLRRGIPQERGPAAEALREIGPDARRAIPALIAALKEQSGDDPGYEQEMKCRAVEALGAMGSEAKAAVPTLLAALGEKSLDECLVVKALGRIDPQNPIVISTVIHFLEKYPEAFGDLANTLCTFGPEVKAAVPMVLRALRTEGRVTYLQAARVLEWIDPEAAAIRRGPIPLVFEGQLPAVALSSGQLETLWTELLGNDGPRTCRATWLLVAAREQAVTFLDRRLQPVLPRRSLPITQLIDDLDNDRFGVRQRAAEELEKSVDVIEPALRQALAGQPSLEVRRRLERFLNGLDPARSPERRRVLRAMEVLALIGSPEAKRILEKMASGVKEARLTQAAKASLERWAKQSVPKP